MSYFNKYKWELVPMNLPVIKRGCPKCKEKSNFINTERFRINANKSSIDVWLIFQCEKCKSTLNMSLYERINPRDINKDEYEKLLANDRELIKLYGFNMSMYSKNKVEVDISNISYEINKTILEKNIKGNGNNIILTSKFPLEIRMDKFLSDNLKIPRNKVKSLIENGDIFSTNTDKLMKVKKIDKEISIVINN